MVKRLLLAMVLTCSMLWQPMAGLAQQIPEEARKHMIRGQMAVEMAKAPEDYALAAREFEAAAHLAPGWADPYYNLGLVRERGGRYAEAAASLREYLRLAPDAADAAAVKEQIYRLEFRAEQELSDGEILEIFASLTDQSRWKLVAPTPADQVNVYNWIRAIRKDGEDLLIDYRSRHDRVRTERVRPAGRHLEFMLIYNLCEPSVQRDECPEVFKYKLEVVSPRKVKMAVRIFFPDIAGQVKAYSTDHALEFVRRN